MKNTHASRIKKALKLLNESGSPDSLLVSSNPHAVRSRDINFPYRQNSDLFYLTGSSHEALTLLLRPHAKEEIVLVAPPPDAHQTLWEGAQPSLAPLARELGAELVLTKDPLTTLRGLLRGTDTVYLQSVAGSVSAELRREFSTRSAIAMRGLPSRIGEAERFTAKLRCIKDTAEVAAIHRAGDLTSAALLHIAQYVRPGIREREIAALIEYLYRLHGAEPAFGTIIASGKSAATLHYRSLAKTLRSGELLLIDTGCELNMYSCDVSRTVPVGLEINPVLREVYETVLRAQKAAIAKVKPGVHINDIYKAAAIELTRGLQELKVLKGSLTQLLQKGAFKTWFPHGIGHSLGIDVHDVSPGSNDRLFTLEKGMVITVEPGLYFSKPIRGIPACGVRIEDDVLVTAKGCEVLTESVFPKEFDEVCAVLQVGA
jgi:Xaa-Pro aminopeptidase